MEYRSRHTYILLLVLAAIFGFVLLHRSPASPSTAENPSEVPGSCGAYQKGIVTIGTAVISVDISDTECKRVLGLSGRESLADGAGMIFVFDVAGHYPFWMQDMNFPLDMVWVGDDLRVSGIEKDVAPSTFDAIDPSKSEIFGGQYLARYVLELPAGYADEKNIQVGNKISFSEKML